MRFPGLIINAGWWFSKIQKLMEKSHWGAGQDRGCCTRTWPQGAICSKTIVTLQLKCIANEEVHFTQMFDNMFMAVRTFNHCATFPCVFVWLQIRIFARKSAIAAGQGEYALNKTGPILKFFEKYYSSSYPLPKSGRSTTHVVTKELILNMQEYRRH